MRDSLINGVSESLGARASTAAPASLLTSYPTSSSISSRCALPSFGRSRAAGPHLDPSLTEVLRTHGVHDEIVMNFRCSEVLSQAVFLEGRRAMAKDAFGIDLSSGGGFIHKRKMANVIASWKESRRQSETKAKIDAVRTSVLPSVRMGEDAQDFHDGRLRAETLAQVISLEVEEAQERSKPEHPKQLHLTLETNLTLRTRHRFISSMPKKVEQLRTKYQVRPGRPDVASVFGRTLKQEELCLPTTAGELRCNVGPDWNHGLEYEFQLHKDSLRRAKEDGLAIGAALWATYNCPQHRMAHWITFLTVATARTEKDKQVKSTALENKVSPLANLRNNPSWSPRKQLALTDRS